MPEKPHALISLNKNDSKYREQARILLCVTPVLPQLFPGDLHFVIVYLWLSHC